MQCDKMTIYQGMSFNLGTLAMAQRIAVSIWDNICLADLHKDLVPNELVWPKTVFLGLGWYYIVMEGGVRK